MKIVTMIRRCLYCRSIAGINHHVIEIEVHDIVVIDIDFETQQIPETTCICESCLRNNVPNLKRRSSDLLGLS